jgi:membrane-bound ClpP family serine protease
VLISILLLLLSLLGIPFWLVGAILFLWITKDIIMYPFVWRAYDKWDTDTTGSLIGLQGRVIECLSPSGYVKVRGELWRAELFDSNHPVSEGESVKILDSTGNTLIVQPEQF